MNRNVITKSDSYKMDHSPMYLPGTEVVVSYFEARKGARYDRTTFFGLQHLIQEYLLKPITKEDVDAAEPLITAHMGKFDRKKWDYIVDKLGGLLPVVIEAVPEGTIVPVDNVLMQVYNTDKKCAWLTNHLETLLTHVWAPCTIATQSREVKEFLKTSLEITSDAGKGFGGLPFMLHDFGMRGASSMESAGMGGLAHLINFSGTDTVIALETAMEYYGAKTAVGYSISATEHSVMTAAGKEGEVEVIKHLLDSYPTGLLAMVSDSYDIKNCVDNIYGKQFRDQILARDGKLVIRPDSGDPLELMPYILNSLGKSFGYTTNSKGYKVLNPKVGVIWGDGIDFDMLKQIVIHCGDHMWSAENLVFGMGGGLLQKVNRDVQRFAFKSCAHLRNGTWVDVYKEPADSSKKSKRGIQKLIKVDGQFKTVRQNDPLYAAAENLLKVVYKDGKMVRTITFDEVRANTEGSL
jgi:nicotinamide phosphoribosyltransferase